MGTGIPNPQQGLRATLSKQVFWGDWVELIIRVQILE